MTNPDLAMQRLKNQQLMASTLKTPAEIVRWMGAVQSQMYNAAKWALGLRARATDQQVEQAIIEGSILRLHVLRPTWHFVAAEDVRWMLALTGPRVKAAMAFRNRELEIDSAILAKSQDVLRQVLAGGKALTRAELEEAINQSGIPTHIPQRFVYILMNAELDGVLCNGPWREKQSTHALIEERIAPVPSLDREQALAELASRYFSSHGPATLRDYCWWSGLTVSESRAGIALARADLEKHEIDGQEFFTGKTPGSEGLPEAFSGARISVSGAAAPTAPSAHLLPNFDEYVVAYTDRSAIFDPALSDRLRLRGGMLNNVFIFDGLVHGSWTREIKKKALTVTASPLWPLSDERRQALESAVQRYGEHFGIPAALQIQP